MSGRRSGGGFSKQLLPFGLEYSDINGVTLEKDANKLVIPINGPITKLERDIGQYYVNFEKSMSEGPFYTGSLQLLRKKAEKGVLYDSGDGINDGIKRYSDRFRKKRKIGRSIDEHPYLLEFFPTELYNVMGVDKKDKKKLISSFNYDRKLVHDGLLEILHKNDQLKLNEILQNINIAVEAPTEQLDEEEEALDEDEDFDEDDDDDYNAEKYFDDGDDDDYGDDDGDDEAAF